MIESPIPYLVIAAVLGGGLWRFEQRSRLKIFTWLPAVVLVYLLGIALSQSGIVTPNPELDETYKTVKSWLLPMMLFLMTLKLDLGAFAGLGKKMLIAYAGAVLSLAIAFISVFFLFGFGKDAAGVFGALSGSWTGGTGNMLAVAAALRVPDSLLGPALIVDSLLYTLWVVLLLLAVPFAGAFARFSRAAAPVIGKNGGDTPELAVTGSPSRTLLIALAVTTLVRALSALLPWLPQTTWLVILATLAGLGASFTPLRHSAKSAETGSVTLYILIAFIGTHAHLGTVTELPRYLLAGAAVLLLHALMMLLLARRFHLDLFSIGVASLANIGGVASAPILAAAYDRTLVPVAVVMAVTGYLIGTVAGLAIALALRTIAA